ncbi:MAG: Amidophosphoribosyltransferase [Hyphomicrobiales bacterium]|nr:Amidophosphoribosyltransferase [Hyphomicrobiales bacterium]
MLHAMLQNVAQQMLDIVYPPSCIACLAAVQQSAALCTACWSSMPFIERPFCERLGTPFTHDLGPGLISPEAIANPPVYGRARAVARFEDGPARQLVHRLKYGDRAELAAPMGRWMARAAAELLPGADLLIPVPLHRRRLFQRRFNQAAVLAQTISGLSGVLSDPLVLRRVRPTPPQVGLSRAQRADNVQGAFRVSPENRPKVQDRKIILVDDVMTSGATANAASRVLLRAGAASVDVVVFARVVRH